MGTSSLGKHKTNTVVVHLFIVMPMGSGRWIYISQYERERRQITDGQGCVDTFRDMHEISLGPRRLRTYSSIGGWVAPALSRLTYQGVYKI